MAHSSEIIEYCKIHGIDYYDEGWRVWVKLSNSPVRKDCGGAILYEKSLAKKWKELLRKGKASFPYEFTNIWLIVIDWSKRPDSYIAPSVVRKWLCGEQKWKVIK